MPRTWCEAGHEVAVLDDLSTGHRDAVPAEARFIEADLAQAADEVLADGFDGVLHFAAKSLVGESVRRPELYWRGNVVTAVELLDAMLRHGTPRLVFSSTAATYGEPEEVPIREDAPTRPTNPYGASKLAIDHAIGSYARAHGLAATSLRYFNVAGAHGRFGERHARGDPSHSSRAPGGVRAARARPDLRRRLAHARRHLHPRLHPRRRPRGARTCWR